MLDVPSEIAEESIALLNFTVAQHRTAMLRIPDHDRKNRLGSTNFLDRATIQRYGILERLVAITESFVHERLGRYIERHAATHDDPPISLVLEDALINASLTWDRVGTAYKNWVGVQLPYTEIEGLVEARNSIAHGLGTLTRAQRQKRQSKISKLANFGINLEGDRLVISEQQLDTARDKCTAFIRKVDHLIPD